MMMSFQKLARSGRWRTEAMRAYDQAALIWVTRGQGRITIAGRTRGYGAHSLILLPRGVMHGFEVGAGGLGTVILLPRCGPADCWEASQFHKIVDIQAQKELTSLLDQLDGELREKAVAYDRAAAALVEMILIWITRKTMPQPETRVRASLRLADSFSRLLEDNFASGKTIASYARSLGVTPTHLSRACRDACGRPASALLQDRIFFEARRMLVETRSPVKEVAARLGFRSAAYFTRAFSHHTGQTPSRFRKSGT